MEVTQAMYLANEMVSRADAGDSALGILGAAGAPFYKTDTSRTENAMNNFVRGIPKETKYHGVVETLITNKDKPGVKETLEQLYQKYPELKEGQDNKKRPSKV
jgi:hypothetical protein